MSERNQATMKTESDNIVEIVHPATAKTKSSKSIKLIPNKLQKVSAIIDKGIMFKTSHTREKSKSNGG